MKQYDNNQERTAEYLKKFDRKKILKSLVNKEKPIIFDIGANLGQSLSEFKSWWGDSEVHCFEPQEECWKNLEEIKNNFSDKEVFINKFAMSSVTEDAKIFYSHEVDNTKGTSGFNKINLDSSDSIHLNDLKNSDSSVLKVKDYKNTINHQREVQVLRADQYMENLDIKNIDLLKIDTQGHEPEVLEGFGARLADVGCVITELMFYDYYERSLSFSDLEKFLIPAGFHLYDINHIVKNPMNGRTDWVDVIYINNKYKELF